MPLILKLQRKRLNPLNNESTGCASNPPTSNLTPLRLVSTTMIRLHQIRLFFVPHTKCPFPVVLQVDLIETRSKLRLKLLGTVTSHLIENRRVEPEIA
jgi:hypothetical protein